MRKLIACAVLVAAASTAFAIDTDKAFDDPAMQARYEHIISEVRCLKCQNQTIKDSNAFLAADLRREIRRMLAEGKTDDERRTTRSTTSWWRDTVNSHCTGRACTVRPSCCGWHRACCSLPVHSCS